MTIIIGWTPFLPTQHMSTLSNPSLYTAQFTYLYWGRNLKLSRQVNKQDRTICLLNVTKMLRMEYELVLFQICVNGKCMSQACFCW